MSKKEKTITAEASKPTTLVPITDKQRQVIAGIMNDKAALENEYKKVLTREQEVIVTLLESAKVDPSKVAGIKIEEGGVLVTLTE